jgi:hypothetical protein
VRLLSEGMDWQALFGPFETRNTRSEMCCSNDNVEEGLYIIYADFDTKAGG